MNDVGSPMHESPELFSDPEGLLAEVKKEVLTSLVSQHSQDVSHSLVPCGLDVLMSWPRSGTMHACPLHL